MFLTLIAECTMGYGVYPYTIDDHKFQILISAECDAISLGYDSKYKAEQVTAEGYVTVPAELNVNQLIPVTKISNFAFLESKLTGIVFPSTINTIENNAFANSYIESIDISKCNINYLPENCFANSSKLKTILFPEITSIQPNALYGINLTVVGMPTPSYILNLAYFPNVSQIYFYKQFSVIESSFFSNLIFLKSISINQSISIIPPSSRKLKMILESYDQPIYSINRKKILQNINPKPKNTFIINLHNTDKYILEDDTNTVIDFAELGVTKIKAFAFANCRSIEQIKGDNVDYIGYACFKNCVSLKKVDLSKSKITNLQPETFANAESLSDIYVPSSLEFVYSDSFNNSSPNIYKNGGKSVEFHGDTSSLKYYGPSGTKFGNLKSLNETTSGNEEESEEENLPKRTAYIPFPTEEIILTYSFDTKYLIICLVLAVLLVIAVTVSIVFACWHVKIERRNALIECPDAELKDLKPSS